MSIRVKLDNKERGYYASLYQAVDANNSNQIGGAQAVQFFKRSGLQIDILKKIWLLSSPNNQTLNKEEFYVALKLISYAQNNIEISHEAIIRSYPSPLPQFQPENPDEHYKLRPEQERLYQNYFTQLGAANNQLQTHLAMALFQKSPLNSQQLQAIINLLDPFLPTKPTMSTHHYTVIAHLISLTSQGIPLPQQLPKSLQDYINSAPQLTPIVAKVNSNTLITNTDLMDFDIQPVQNSTTTPIGKSPIAKYSAFNLIDEKPIQTQQLPQQQIQQSKQIEKKYSIDLSAQDQSIEQQQQQQQQQSISKPEVKIDQTKFNSITESFVVQQQTHSENIQQNNELLGLLKEQNVKQLQQAEQQLELMYKMSEQYQTIIKKFTDENDLFQEELKGIQNQKKQLIDQISKQAVETYSKISQNSQIKQEYQKQQNGALHEITSHSIAVITQIRTHYEEEKQHQKKIENDILKEMKLQREQLYTLGTQLNTMNINIQRKPSYQQYHAKIDTDQFVQIQQEPIIQKPITIEPIEQTKLVVIENKNISQPKEISDFQENNKNSQKQISNLTLPNLQEIIVQLDQVNESSNELPQVQQADQQNDLPQAVILQQTQEQEISPKEILTNTIYTQSIQNDTSQSIKQENVDNFDGIQENKLKIENNPIEIEGSSEQNCNFDQGSPFNVDFNFKAQDPQGGNFEFGAGDFNIKVDKEQNSMDFGFKQTVQIEFDPHKEFNWDGFDNNFGIQNEVQQQDQQEFKW